MKYVYKLGIKDKDEREVAIYMTNTKKLTEKQLEKLCAGMCDDLKTLAKIMVDKPTKENSTEEKLKVAEERLRDLREVDKNPTGFLTYLIEYFADDVLKYFETEFGFKKWVPTIEIVIEVGDDY